MKTVFPKISNWNDVKEQFGLDSQIDHKNAKELSKDLLEAANAFDFETAEAGTEKRLAGIHMNKAKDATEMSLVCIEYQKNNNDSGICMFQFIGVESGNPVFEYTGTAK
jgi:hypothetical protein